MVDLREEPALRFVGASAANGLCTITERRGLCLTRLIAVRGREAVLPRLLGHELPGPPGTSRAVGGGAVFSLAPRDWLVVRHDPDGRRGGFAVDLRRHLDGVALAIDQSHARVVLRLTGPITRRLLQKGIDIDLHPEMLGPGAVAQTAIVGMAVLVHAVAETTIDLYGFRSYSESLLDWLLEAGQEWKIVMEAPGA